MEPGEVDEVTGAIIAALQSLPMAKIKAELA